ncbi:MAG: 50S ribosomal protein L24 [Patescibacteria group bacterium]|nr:50S ribosomal protein L24 [Patescibacteria group bacterium]MDD5490202.1 50S ribosomal protein L24 [Patescibacteria group bacterium]
MSKSKIKIKKGDKVKVLAGKDKGKTAKVLQVLIAERQLVAEGINVLTKHARPRRQGEKGQKIELPAPINASNAMLICPKCDKATRVGYKFSEAGKKLRVCRKCKETI